MVETLLPPDVVKALIPFLSGRLTARNASAHVSSRIPSTRPTRLVRITQAGGGRRNVALLDVFVLVECWDTDEAKSHGLAALCLAEIEAATRSQDPIAPGVWIGAAEDGFGLPANFPDPVTSLPRFQFTCSLLVTPTPI